MSLDNKPKGNPNWLPGKSGNPHGRPAGAKSLKGLLKVAATLAEKKRHPVDELVRLADKAEANGTKVVITKPGSTTWKVGDIVEKSELATLNSMMKPDSVPAEGKTLPGTGNAELAAKIWADLLKYCEPQKKAVETAPEKPTTPEESKAAADAAMKYLQDLENGQDTRTDGSDQVRLGAGETSVSPEAGSTPDLPSDKDV